MFSKFRLLQTSFAFALLGIAYWISLIVKSMLAMPGPYELPELWLLARLFFLGVILPPVSPVIVSLYFYKYEKDERKSKFMIAGSVVLQILAFLFILLLPVIASTGF